MTQWRADVAARMLGQGLIPKEELEAVQADVAACCDYAEALAREACTRWGHTQDPTCFRCGEPSEEPDEAERDAWKYHCRARFNPPPGVSDRGGERCRRLKDHAPPHRAHDLTWVDPEPEPEARQCGEVHAETSLACIAPLGHYVLRSKVDGQRATVGGQRCEREPTPHHARQANGNIIRWST